MTNCVDESYRLLAAGFLRRQAKRLAGQLDGVRKAEDIEFVHRARVASRRLRAAMRMFRDCFDARQFKRWRKQIRRVTTGLGDARDRDVQIEFLCGALDDLQEKACYSGIARLLVRLEQKRERLQSKVVKAVDRLQSSGVVDEMLAVAKQIISEAKAQKLGVQSPVAFDQTGQHLLHGLEQMLAYQDSLEGAEQKERHHAMRIAAKQLRYTVEISKPVYDGQLDESVTVIKRVQTLLGDVHDCDVWLEHLDVFAEKERGRILKHFGHAVPFVRLEAGIEHLRQQRRARRRQAFEELVDYWRELDGQGYWEKMVSTIQQRGRQPQRPGSPAEATAETTAKPAPHWKQSDCAGTCQGAAEELRPCAQQVGKPEQQVTAAAETARRINE
jgi:CHAD domain-containing protein